MFNKHSTNNHQMIEMHPCTLVHNNGSYTC